MEQHREIRSAGTSASMPVRAPGADHHAADAALGGSGGASRAGEQAVKEEAAENPARDDVHEQREEGQPREGTVRLVPSEEPAKLEPTPEAARRESAKR